MSTTVGNQSGKQENFAQTDSLELVSNTKIEIRDIVLSGFLEPPEFPRPPEFKVPH